MKVFVAGATGVLGRRLVRRFSEGGHHVVGMTRSDAGDQSVLSNGGVPHRSDLFAPETFREAASGSDLMIHAATSVPVGKAPDEKWEQHTRVVSEGARSLSDMARSVKPRFYLQQSVIWRARQADGSAYDEDSPTQPDQGTQGFAYAEDMGRDLSAQVGTHVSILRCGWFYSADSGQTREFAESLKSRKLPAIGGGVLGRKDAYTSLIHADDAAEAFYAAAQLDRVACGT